jgi:hypothetical protein
MEIRVHVPLAGFGEAIHAYQCRYVYDYVSKKKRHVTNSLLNLERVDVVLRGQV